MDLTPETKSWVGFLAYGVKPPPVPSGSAKFGPTSIGRKTLELANTDSAIPTRISDRIQESHLSTTSTGSMSNIRFGLRRSDSHISSQFTCAVPPSSSTLGNGGGAFFIRDSPHVPPWVAPSHSASHPSPSAGAPRCFGEGPMAPDGRPSVTYVGPPFLAAAHRSARPKGLEFDRRMAMGHRRAGRKHFPTHVRIWESPNC